MILMVAAESIEFDGLRKHFNTRVVDWGLDFSAIAPVPEFALVANGPGRNLAAAAVSKACAYVPVTALVSVGFCGALDSALDVGAIVIANRVIDQNSSHEYSTAQLKDNPQAACGAVISTDHVAVTANEKSALAAKGAIAVEMEAAGVAMEAERRNIPLHCIRAVSDTSKEDMPIDFNECRSSEGRFSRAAVARVALMRPLTRIPALLAFQRNCRFASMKLGEFLADCRF